MFSKDAEVNNHGVPTAKVILEIDSLKKMVQGQYYSCSGGFCPSYRTSAMNDIYRSVLMIYTNGQSKPRNRFLTKQWFK